MGWLLNEGTATMVILLLAMLALSPGSRRWLRRAASAVGRRARPAPSPPPVLTHRPFECVVRDVRRLRRVYAATRTGVSFAKSEAVRRAYDDVLAEGCAALDVTHLLGVLDGEELEQERLRVERMLHRWGLGLDDAA